MYSEICISFPRLTKLSDSRKKAIKARSRQYGIEDFKWLFELAEKSSFLKGQNNRNWSANFDWCVYGMIDIVRKQWGQMQQNTKAAWGQMVQNITAACREITSTVQDMSHQVSFMCDSMIAEIETVKAAAASLGGAGMMWIC